MITRTLMAVYKKKHKLTRQSLKEKKFKNAAFSLAVFIKRTKEAGEYKTSAMCSIGQNYLVRHILF